MPTDINLTSDRSGLPAETLVPDTALAERLGYEHPRHIRKLIKRNLSALEAMGLVIHDGTPIVSGKGRVQHVTTYSLNRAQAAFLVSKARTKRADSLAIVIAELFAEFSQGGLVAKDAEAQARIDGITERAAERMGLIREEEIEARRRALKLLRRGGRGITAETPAAQVMKAGASLQPLLNAIDQFTVRQFIRYHRDELASRSSHPRAMQPVRGKRATVLLSPGQARLLLDKLIEAGHRPAAS